jgi:predicted amidohydrolase
MAVIKAAAVQLSPVLYSREGTVDKVIRQILALGREGVQFATFPETVVPYYPYFSFVMPPFKNGAEHQRLLEQAVTVPSDVTLAIGDACRQAGVVVSLGVNERDGGTLYNTLAVLGPEGLLHKHRKLMPTQHERLFHGIGGGRDLEPVDTPVGRVGGLICWENRMPLARWAVYQGAPQIWVAPTADDSDGWLASMRHIAIESGAFVVSVPQYIPGSAFPDDFPIEIDREAVYGRGGAAIVEPTWGEVIAGPVYDAETVLVADCDLRVGLHAKRWFDAVGHYSRTDVLSPTS